MAEKLTTETIVKALRCASHVDSCPVSPCDEKCPYFCPDLCVAEDQHIWAAQAADKIEELAKHENTILLACDGERYTADGLKGLIEEKRNLLQACEEHRREMDQLRKERDEWKRRAEAAERDLDYLVKDGARCETCRYYKDMIDGKGKFRTCGYAVDASCNNYEWRGPCEENGGVDK